uniref:Uncharacterized protein n=1 Tax=Emiliania huxleyi TaxID=2903 RepID=A0A6S9V5L9_EMIHU|mmetsp:Transcript_175/g.454  ORF Transcript_175/g.454 Transcript_175/m.454 type:complete len:170 (-) Transcript_175:187-696(-)
MSAAIVVGLLAAPSPFAHTGATEEQVKAKYTKVAELFEELKATYKPLMEETVHERVPEMLRGVVESVSTFASELDWAPSLGSVGKLIDDVAWGPETGPLAGEGLDPKKCGGSESCQQAVGAAQAVTGAFKGNTMITHLPFISALIGSTAQAAAPPPPEYHYEYGQAGPK